MDDLDWTYAQDPGREATDGIVHRELSEPERTEPHLRAVFELIVAQHPSFTELRVQDEWWGWARKAPGEPRRYTLETSRPLGALVAGGAAPGGAARAQRPPRLTGRHPGHGGAGRSCDDAQTCGGSGDVRRARAGGLRRRRRRRRCGELRAGRDRGREEGARRSTRRKGAKGTVTMCAGKDTSGALTEAIELFNKQHAADGLKVEKLELAADATEVRNQFIQRAQAKSRRVRRAAGRHHLDRRVRPAGVDHGPHRLRERRARTSSSPPRCPPTTTTASSGALPQVTGAGLLYRRTDQVAGARPRPGRSSTSRAPPTTASPTRAPPYEGLTCNFVELSSAAGGRILSEDGTKAEFDSPENLKALQLMVDGMKSGGAVKASRTYMEEPARIAFESGKATLHAQLELRLRARQEGAEGQGHASRSPRCRRSRAAARAACWAATGRS